jgi:hypothetical protein
LGFPVCQRPYGPSSIGSDDGALILMLGIMRILGKQNFVSRLEGTCRTNATANYVKEHLAVANRLHERSKSFYHVSNSPKKGFAMVVALTIVFDHGVVRSRLPWSCPGADLLIHTLASSPCITNVVYLYCMSQNKVRHSPHFPFSVYRKPIL